jgi:hypothetical protein
LKKLVFLWLIFLTFCLSNLAEEDDLLKANSSINPKRLSRGQEGKVVITFTIQKGITIKPQPSFIIEFNPSEELVFPKNFFTASDLEVEILEEDGEEYLDLKEPIEIPFAVNLEAKRGSHILEGKVKYFAFSKEEGWCLKSYSKFRASFYTRSTIIKKKK